MKRKNLVTDTKRLTVAVDHFEAQTGLRGSMSVHRRTDRRLNEPYITCDLLLWDGDNIVYHVFGAVTVDGAIATINHQINIQISAT